MAEAVTSSHSLKLSDSDASALLHVKIGEKKVHCKSNNMLVSHFCNTVLLLLPIDMGSLHCVAQQRNEHLTKSQGF